MSEILLLTEHLTKTFPGTRALNDFSFELRAGEVHALMGENGAGKTTLLMLLSGVLAPDAGQIVVAGEPVRFTSPRDAQAAGIGTVFQELSLVDSLTIAENVFANRLPAGPIGWIDRRALTGETRALLRQLGSALDPDRRVAGLRTGSRQLVEIAKALSLKARVLLMDEPTSALSSEDAHTLFGVIARLKEQGIAILFVSHRLAEVFQVADRITIMRDGNLVATRPRGELTEDEAVRLMVGRVLSHLYPDRATGSGPVRLEVHGLRAAAVGPIDLTVHGGEIVGLAGLRGSGRSRLARAIFGAEPVAAGEILIDGRRLKPGSTENALRRGIAFVPSERKEEGVFLRMPVRENLVVGALRRVTRLGLVSSKAATQLARRLIRDLDIRTTGPGQTVSRLSGGNQQKVMLAKWLATEPRVLIVDEPTQGIDVGAKAEIHGLLRRMAASGIAVLMISSDLPEVLGMCDRIAVMRRGQLAAMLDGKSATEEMVMAQAAGTAA